MDTWRLWEFSAAEVDEKIARGHLDTFTYHDSHIGPPKLPVVRRRDENGITASGATTTSVRTRPNRW